MLIGSNFESINPQNEVLQMSTPTFDVADLKRHLAELKEEAKRTKSSDVFSGFVAGVGDKFGVGMHYLGSLLVILYTGKKTTVQLPRADQEKLEHKDGPEPEMLSLFADILALGVDTEKLAEWYVKVAEFDVSIQEEIFRLCGTYAWLFRKINPTFRAENGV